MISIKKFLCLFSLFICLSIISCSSIPRQEIGNYNENFITAKTTTQDILLIVRLIAESEEAEGHENAILLEEKLKSLDARIEALELISNYNDILVSLAIGTDPEAVYGSLSKISTGLNSFGSAKLSALVESAMPYGELISQAVALIDNAIKAEKFKDAVDAAHKPILGIIEILILDSDDLFEIQSQTLSRGLDIERDRVIDTRFDFDELVNSYKDSSSIEQLITDFNKIMEHMKTDPDELPDPVEHSSDTNIIASTSDLITMNHSIDILEEAIQNYNGIVEQLNAIDELKNQYKNILKVTSESFENLYHAIQYDQYPLPIDITIDVLNLRKAYLKLQEAKK